MLRAPKLAAYIVVIAPIMMVAPRLTSQCTPTQNVGKYDVFEYTFTRTTLGYSTDHLMTPNVWEDIEVVVALTSPTGQIVNIGGFYYDTDTVDDTWKFRFAPNEHGTWNWSYDFKVGGSTVAADMGCFKCVASFNRGVVRQNPTNPFRWVFDEGQPFYPYGLRLA